VAKNGLALKTPGLEETEEEALMRIQVSIAFQLAYHLGMRAGEAEAVRRDWFLEDEHDGIIKCVIRSREDQDFKPKNKKERRVPVPRKVYDYLMEVGGETYLLSGTPTDRHNTINRELSRVMRGWGWARRQCSHELRKCRCCYWTAQIGLENAHWFAGHSSYEVTTRHYAGQLHYPEPLRINHDLDVLKK